MAYKQISPQSVAEGGTGAQTLTDHGVLVGSGTSAVTALTGGTNGQLLVGSSAADPVFATVSSSDSLLTLTGGAGTLDIVAQNAVSAAASLTDNLVIRGDGGTTGVQTSTISITDAGEMTNTSQPAFMGTLDSQDSDVTGNNTTYTIGTNVAFTEVFDQNGDFNTNGTFTAPVSGKYYLEAMVTNEFPSMASATVFTMVITTSNDSFRSIIKNSTNTEPFRSNNCSVVAEMDASDTCIITVNVNGVGADTVDVSGSTTPITWFCGYLAC